MYHASVFLRNFAVLVASWKTRSAVYSTVIIIIWPSSSASGSSVCFYSTLFSSANTRPVFYYVGASLCVHAVFARNWMWQHSGRPWVCRGAQDSGVLAKAWHRGVATRFAAGELCWGCDDELKVSILYVFVIVVGCGLCSKRAWKLSEANIFENDYRQPWQFFAFISQVFCFSAVDTACFYSEDEGQFLRQTVYCLGSRLQIVRSTRFLLFSYPHHHRIEVHRASVAQCMRCIFLSGCTSRTLYMFSCHSATDARIPMQMYGDLWITKNKLCFRVISRQSYVQQTF